MLSQEQILENPASQKAYREIIIDTKLLAKMATTHKIILGDALKVLKSIPSESIDLVFADPPYNMSKKNGLGWKYSKHITMQEEWDMFSKDDYFKFNQEWLNEALRTLKHGGSLWVCGSFHNIYQVGFILQQMKDVKINNSIVWFKPNAQPNITCRMFTESTEHLIWASKNGNGKKWKFNYKWTKDDITDEINPKGKQTRNVWWIPLTPKSEKWAGSHPTQKPFELLKRIILSCTNSGDTVLDPFLGSGTTSIVAKHYDRNSIGIEINKKYMDIIKKRLQGEQKTLSSKEPEIIFEEFNQ
ncbi:MAG TPA: DNA methyltransferase [Candidatus Nanoarchaeia archaeon]|nr:DNA methyltransferase [Candidatus Nanoarchaeia archaeon]